MEQTKNEPTKENKAALAESHCEDMIDRNFFAHNTPDGQTPFDRMKAAGISYSSAGENIAAGQYSPQNVMDSWMNSPGHRKNILNPDFEYLGVGLARGGSYGIYWAQEIFMAAGYGVSDVLMNIVVTGREMR